METLSDNLYDAIITEIDNGDNEMEKESFDSALQFYQKALEKIPEPKHDWEISLHVYTALGDVCFNLKDFGSASYYYNQALQCPDGTVNGYVWLGLGQSYIEIDETDKAKNALMNAYMLEGNEIFEGEGRQYFRFIEDIVGTQEESDEDETDKDEIEIPKPQEPLTPEQLLRQERIKRGKMLGGHILLDLY